MPPDPGIATAALGASESDTLPGTAPAEALHTFTLDPDASRCFFRDSTTLTPLPAPVPVRLADPSGGPVVARSSTVLPCPVVPSGSLSGLHLPSFSTNLVSTAALQNAMVTATTPGGQRVSICSCTQTGRHLATFTRRPGSSLYTLTTEPSQVAASAQVSVSASPAPSPAPPYLPCVEGRQRAVPHSSSFPPTNAPLQTLHMDVWGPARVSGQSRERYFVLVVDDYKRYTTVFPLLSKGQVVDVLIPWIRTIRLQLRERFGQVAGLGTTRSPSGTTWRTSAVDGRVSSRAPRQVTAPDPGLSPQQLREWFVRRTRLQNGASGAGGAGAARAGGPGVAVGAGVTGGTATTGPGGARTRGSGAAGTGGVEGARVGDPSESGTPCAGGAGAGGAGVGDPDAGGAGVGGAGAVDPGGTVRPRPYFVPLLQQVLGTLPSAALTPPLLCPPPDQSQPPLQPASPLPTPSPYTEQSGGLIERREPASCPVSPVCTARCVPRSRPPPVPVTHAKSLRPSSVPLSVPLPATPESSLPEVPDPESDCARAASPTVSRLLTTAVTDPSFESAAASALIAELLDFASACRLDYASALVAESASASPQSVGGECALGTDVLEDRQEDFESLAAAVPRFASMLLAPEGDPDAPDIPTPRSYTEAITGPYSSQWQATMDAEMASWKSICTYVDEVPPPGANIVDGMWIFRVKRPPGSPPTFKARYIARGFSQRQGVDYFQTFSPTLKMTTLRVLLHVAAQRDYELHSLDFSTVFLQGSLHEEIWLRRPPGFTESFPTGTQWILWRPVYGLHQAPGEWHDTLRTTLAALGFAPSTADPSLFLRIDT
ncbi:unnamed protein product [Closterium sp. NIES-54]